METIDPIWLFSGIALVIGLVLGALAQTWFGASSRDNDNLRMELENARLELESYRENVNRHFSKTSDLVGELTQDYVKVYQHLAEGAQTLGNNPEFARVLEQSQGRVLISVEAGEARADAAAKLAEPAVNDARHSATAASGSAGETDSRADHRSRERASDVAQDAGVEQPPPAETRSAAGGDEPVEQEPAKQS